jgi:cell shape-determining protein MreC
VTDRTAVIDAPPAGEPAPADAETLADGDVPPALPPRHRHVTPRRIAIRRGVVLGLLVVAILTSTAFVNESSDGLLHSGKSGVTSFSGRVQDVAVAAVRPVRDGWQWFSDLRTARDDRNRLQKEVDQLRADAVGQEVDTQRLDDLEQILQVRDEAPSDYRAVTASIISRPLVDVAREARIDRGAGDGITENSLVLVPNDGKVPATRLGILVGRVTHVDAHTADIVFLTSTTTKIAARTLHTTTKLGLLTANALGDLSVSGVPGSQALSLEDPVVTVGVGTDRLMSPYPPDMLIGYVSDFGGVESGGDWTVQVTPYADPNNLRTVMIYVPKTALAKRRAGIQ